MVRLLFLDDYIKVTDVALSPFWNHCNKEVRVCAFQIELSFQTEVSALLPDFYGINSSECPCLLHQPLCGSLTPLSLHIPLLCDHLHLALHSAQKNGETI